MVCLQVSGRDLFEFNPDLVVESMDGEEGDADFDLSAYKREDDDDDGTTVSTRKIPLPGENHWKRM
jgi:hypothetical protein